MEEQKRMKSIGKKRLLNDHKNIHESKLEIFLKKTIIIEDS